MDRLIDYFAVVGYDHDADDKEHTLRGKVLLRVPDNDWKDFPFTSGIELFCQPGGWYLSREKLPPTFFVSVLTDAEGHQQYCAVHCFSEPLHFHSPTHTRNQRRKQSAIPGPRPTSVYRAKSDSDVTENGLSNSDVAHGEDFIDEEMCRVESGDIDVIAEPFSNNKTNSDSKYNYAPKCLVLLSRVKDFRVLKNCLGLIYTIYIEGLSQSIEDVIAKMLLVKVPPPGSSLLRFSIGAADKQALQTPRSDQLPITRSSVTMLLKQLGILNVLNILCAALVDQKLLFYSCSYTRLTEACNALTALMYPFSYSYPYIPILPRHLLECSSSPTPFLFGVHSSFKSELNEMLDVITVDLDGGVISIPECVSIPVIPEPYCNSVVEALTKVLCPDLVVADWAYPPEQARTSEPERLDKEIRAIFLRLFSQILMGYRSSLQVCRIHPKPIIRFQKDHYLTMRGFDATSTPSANEFVPKLLDSQAFSLFVQDNGPPFRRLHKFDEVVSEMADRIHADIADVHHALKHVKELSSDLYMNENPNHIPLTERIPKPSEGSYQRANQRRFPKLSSTAVQAFMEEKKSIVERERQPKFTRQTCKRVPEGNRPVSYASRLGAPTTSSRRLEVLKNCLSFIMENKTLEIKKIFQAVIRALKSRAVRFALTHELASYAKSHALLDTQQFEYISRLINTALQDSSGQHDENTLAADMLPVVTNFHRKLGPAVTQFMYSAVQEHPVWCSSLFWQSAFFDDIQDEIRNLYKDSMKNKRRTRTTQVTTTSRFRDYSPSKPLHGTDFSSGATNQLANQREALERRDNQLCMEIAAIQLQEWEQKSPEQQEEISSAEEEVVFSQAMYNAQRMVFMLVPLDSSRINRSKFLRNPAGEENSSNSYFTGSVAGSINGSDEESGFDETQEGGNDVSASVTKFISKFVDRVCTEAYINSDHTKTLLNKIPTLVHMQVEALQDVCRESKRLPPIMKPKLLQPKLLNGEALALDKACRAYLASDGRGTATRAESGGPNLLPAEGALFLTSYRVIFIGIPCDALASEQVVIRSFPVSTLFKTKTFNVHDYPRIAEVDNSLQHGILLRSSTFQLFLLAFDEEVTKEEQDLLRNELHRLRYPNTIEGSFALSAGRFAQISSHLPNETLMRSSSGISGASNALSSSKMSGAKILYKQAKRKAGLDKTNRTSRLITTNSKHKTLQYNTSSVTGSRAPSSTLSRMPVIDEAMTKTLSDKDTMNQLIKRSCESDYTRMKLISVDGSPFRFSRVNRMLSVCRSHPTCVVVPNSITDDQIKAMAHCHIQARFPAIVWKHPTNNAVLLRSSAIKSRTAGSIFKRGQPRPIASGEEVLASSLEEERFLFKIASLVVLPSETTSMLFRPSSVSSLASMEDETRMSPPPLARGGTPHGLSNSSRLNKSKKWSTLTRANGRPASEHISTSPPSSRSPASGHGFNGSLTQAAIHNAASRQAQLYVFGDKAQLKNLKHEQQGKVMFVPTELAEAKQIRMSFKVLLKSCLPADSPASAPTSSSQQLQDTISSYLKEVQDSMWMEQVSNLIQTAGSVVDVMDIHGASVMLAIDDGTDVVPQLSSLSQLLQDPYYRTIEGFQTLVQKEWLSFGHRFSHRNRFNDIESSGFTPVFLMFLDAVYQIHIQFPMSFEFNEMYLEAIAYHFMSSRFTTFLLDSDFERLEAGILFEKKSRRRSRISVNSENSQGSSGSPVRAGNQQIKCLWEYLNAAHKRSPVFFNPLYSPENLFSQVLRPISSMCRLEVWPYYVREVLGEGPPYDTLLGELTAGTSHNEQEATEVSEAWGGATGRRVVSGCYDNVGDAQPDSIKMLLNKIGGLQGELGIPVDSWVNIWEHVNDTTTRVLQVPDHVLLARADIRRLHKISTVDMLQKAAEAVEFQSQHPLQSKMRSMSSAFVSSVSSSSFTPHSVIPEEPTESNHSDHVTADLNASPISNRSTEEVPVFQTTIAEEVRTYEGALWKQGALMKGWKLRFFVLDTTKHELRQYENRGDAVSKNMIGLKDLESVQRIESVSSAPKGANDKACFEVKISKRLYNFIAEDERAADDWVDNLQAALQ